MTERSRILVVDDDEDIVKLAKIMIGYMGHDVTATTDNLSVFKRLSEEHYDLLLLDIQMPKLDGFEICRRVTSGQFGDIKVVLFTASADVDVVSKGKKAGALHVLSKPFSIEKIKETIEKILEQRKSVPL